MIVSRLPEEKNKSDYSECIRLKQKSDKFGNKRKKREKCCFNGPYWQWQMQYASRIVAQRALHSSLLMVIIIIFYLDKTNSKYNLNPYRFCQINFIKAKIIVSSKRQQFPLSKFVRMYLCMIYYSRHSFRNEYLNFNW